MMAVEKPFPEGDLLAGLRRRIAVLEGRPTPEARLAPVPAAAANRRGPARLVTGLEAFDSLFAAPGLALGALHEMTSAETRAGGALGGFAAGLASLLGDCRGGDLLWILDPKVVRETGMPYAAGLARFGLDPARIIVVAPRRIEECLWAMEEGARSPALFAVVGEMHGTPKALDLTATRRLSLKAQASGVTVFLLRHASNSEPTAALTRFCVSPRRSTAERAAFVGRPGWYVRLNKNRDGRSGELELEWDHARRSFIASADIEPLVSRPFDRQAATQGSGQVVAFSKP